MQWGLASRTVVATVAVFMLAVACTDGGSRYAAPPSPSTPGSAPPASATPIPAAPSSTPVAQPSPIPQASTSCQGTTALTVAETEGPYFKSGSPERTSFIEAGVTGTKLVITGQVFSPDCEPVANARVEFWQADARGNYDNSGYRLRGHQTTDGQGTYQLTTIVPGLYPGRTRHIHFKVIVPKGPTLTSQLYFPNEPGNANDGIFDRSLVLPIQDMPDGSKAATFNFVVKIA